jgi:succinate dehydrogenase / fumarate reductase flavoprotein subunit
LDRIRTEDIPAMVVSDTSPVYNTEWKEAIEAYNMLDICEISARASLMREETRGMYLRGDFPEQDDVNWDCMIVCRNNNGMMELEKQELPKLEVEQSS